MAGKTHWRSRFKLFGGTLGILLGLAIAFLLIEKIRGAMELNRRIAHLQQQGERLAVADFEPVQAKPGDDAATALHALSNRLESVSLLSQITPPSGRFTKAGQQIRVTQLISWSVEKKTNTWAEVAANLAGDKTLLGDVHTALIRPGWNDGCEYHNGFIEFKLGPLVLSKNLSQLLAFSALVALRSNDIELAVARIEDAGLLLRHQTNSPLIVSQLVRNAEAVILWNATWELIISGKCSEPQLTRLQAAWDGMDFNADMSRAMTIERNMTLEHYDLIISSGEKRAKAMEELAQAGELGLNSRPPTKGFILNHIHVPIWSFSWARQDELRSLNRWQAVIEFDRAARSNSWSGVSDQVSELDEKTGILAVALSDEDAPKQNLYNRLRYLCSGMTFSIGSNTTRKSMQIETQRRMLVTAIAIERWKLRRGRYPGSLDELVPELLSTMPVDLMNNQPLSYKLTKDGVGLVYSVGDDARNDGGDPIPEQPIPAFRKIWDGKDAVWPQPASTQDAEWAAHAD